LVFNCAKTGQSQVVTGREYFAAKEAVSLTCSLFFYIGENSPKREINKIGNEVILELFNGQM
jgi:hypothetical protein